MRRRVMCTLSLLACLALAVGGFAQGKGGGKKGGGGGKTGEKKISVTAEFRDAVGDRIQSDGFGPYVDGEGKVNALITAGNVPNPGEFRMTTNKTEGKAAGRELEFDFAGACMAGEVCTPPIVVSSFGTVRTLGTTVNLLAMTVDPLTTLDVGVRLRFSAPDPVTGEERGWALRFEPSDPDCAGSSLVNVTRTSESEWLIEALASDVACLFPLPPGSEMGNRGLFHMPLQVTVRKK